MIGAMLLALANPADLGLGPEWVAVADVRAEVTAGLLECDTPNHSAKTCEGLADYRVANDGSINAFVLVPINNEPDLAITFVAPTWIDDNMVCGRLEQSDFDRMELVLGTKKYDAPSGRELLSYFRTGMAEMFLGKLICARYFANGDRRYAVTFVDGVHSPEFDGESAWVTADSGYDARAAANILPE